MSKWDLYDKSFNKTGEVIESTTQIPDGKYHYSINMWVINSRKELLLIRNTLNQNIHYPGFWNSMNGNVESNETPLDACKRALYSKIGVKLSDEKFEKKDTCLRDPYHYIYETYIIYEDIDINDISFVDNSAVQAKWIDLTELYNMIENGEIAWVMIPRIEKYVIPNMK